MLTDILNWKQNVNKMYYSSENMNMKVIATWFLHHPIYTHTISEFQPSDLYSPLKHWSYNSLSRPKFKEQKRKQLLLYPSHLLLQFGVPKELILGEDVDFTVELMAVPQQTILLQSDSAVPDSSLLLLLPSSVGALLKDWNTLRWCPAFAAADFPADSAGTERWKAVPRPIKVFFLLIVVAWCLPKVNV